MGEGGGQSNAEDGLSLVFRQCALPHPFKQWLPRHHTSQTNKTEITPDLHPTANT